MAGVGGYYDAYSVPAGVDVVYDKQRDLFVDASRQVPSACCGSLVPPTQQKGVLCVADCKTSTGELKRCCDFCGFQQSHTTLCEFGGDLYCSKACMPECECGGEKDDDESCRCDSKECTRCQFQKHGCSCGQGCGNCLYYGESSERVADAS